MAEITLADLLAWEPRLRAVAGDSPAAGVMSGVVGTRGTDVDLERVVTWAVTARASAPMLPPLRGGELVLLPRRVLAEAAISLPLLLRELAAHDVGGVVVEDGAPPPGRAPLPVLTLPAGTMAPGHDLEGELNRLLTRQRGELYRAGTELGRLLAGLTTTDAGVGQVLNATAAALRIPAAVVDARGAPLAASGPEALPLTAASGAAGSAGTTDRLAFPLAGGETLWLGPVPRHQRALARLVGERVAVAAEAALTRAARTRPRGPARAAALAGFLTGGTVAGAASDVGARTAALGLATEGAYRVALAEPDIGATELQRRLTPLGLVHDAGMVDGSLAAVVEVRPDAPTTPLIRTTAAPRGGSGTRPGARAAGPVPAAWLALSGVAARPADLPAATREARYVAALLASGALRGPTARFDAVGDLGAYRLLYQHWGTDDLAAFASGALGELPAGDRRGTLRRTLLTYLEAGGSHVEAAAQLQIHRNTLAYRLKQIAALTGHDPTNPQTRLLLHLALLAAKLPPAPEAV